MGDDFNGSEPPASNSPTPGLSAIGDNHVFPMEGRASPNEGGASSKHAASRRDALQSKVTPVFDRMTEATDGVLEVSRLAEFLCQLEMDNDPKLVESLIEPGTQELTLEASLAVIRMIAPSSPTGTTRSSWSSLAKAPLKKVLTKNRDYMETGTLAVDETVLAYIAKLEEHRKKCESERRYPEAKAASLRLADLKTAQVERLRLELTSKQKVELEDVHDVYSDESAKFEVMWDKRAREYKTNFARSVEEMQELHARQCDEYSEDLEARRPTKPKPSRDYLNQKKIEESLVKVKLYNEASQVKSATEEMYVSEMEQAQSVYSADQKLKLVKFQSKQAHEFEALLQRGQRGRDELQLRRVSETDKRNNRFRNIVMELESLHKLEVVHLENFLDGQVQAGKAVPLKDGFRRRREALYNTNF